jgi:DNA polymerase
MDQSNFQSFIPQDAAAEDWRPITGNFYWDTETRGRLKFAVKHGSVGSERYLRDPHTSILLIQWACDGGEVQIWRPGDSIAPLAAAVAQSRRFVAHNIAAFDHTAWMLHMVPLGLPPIPLEQCSDTAARARAIGILASLDGAAKILLPPEYHKASKAIVRRMCQPRHAWPGEDPNELHWVDDAESWAEFIAYAKQDVEVLRALDRVLPPLVTSERRVLLCDWIINQRGVGLDGPGIAGCCERIREGRLAANARLSELTSAAITSTDQHPKIRQRVNALGVALADMKAKSLRRELARDDLPTEARQLLELRLDAAQAAAAKPIRMRAWRCEDGRARWTLIYHGATPGRWAGTGVQFQNVKKPGEDDLNDDDADDLEDESS